MVGQRLYAVGQCADILAFRPAIVPVGEDQIPHLELTREVARKFNQLYCGVNPQTEDKDYLSAGGLLPVAFTLMAETVPAAHRGWLLVALGGIGTSAGYLLAAGAAATLEPMFSWRVLWLLGLPTGALIVFLNRYIPESPRFLSDAGLLDQARAVLGRFSVQLEADDADQTPAIRCAVHRDGPIVQVVDR